MKKIISGILIITLMMSMNPAAMSEVHAYNTNTTLENVGNILDDGDTAGTTESAKEDESNDPSEAATTEEATKGEEDGSEEDSSKEDASEETVAPEDEVVKEGARGIATNSEGTIYQGVYIDTVDASGLTKDEAYAAYEEYMTEIIKNNLVLTTVNGECNIPLEDIGLDVSLDDAVETAFNYGRKGNILRRYKEINNIKQEPVVLNPPKTGDQELLATALEEDTEDIITKAKSAKLTRKDGKFYCEPGVVGISLKNEETIDAVNKAMEAGWSEGDITVEAVCDEEQPKYTEKDFAKVVDVLGSYSTTYSGPASRDNNLAVGTKHVNGKVLYPGQEFDMYETVQPFNADNGYQEAGQYSDGELIQGYGGGICQVTSTLYMAVVKAELKVTARSPHSYPASYVPKSYDAAIAGTYKNFKFVNTTDYPIYIEGITGGGKMTFTIYGCETRPSNRTITFESRVITTIPYEEPEETVDDTKPAGYRERVSSAHTGYYCEMWKHIFVDGVETDSVRVNASTYRMQNAKYIIGPEEPTTEAPTTSPTTTPTDTAAPTTAPTEASTEAPAAN